MFNRGQFLLEYEDLFDSHIPKENNEGKLYKLLEVYDDNLYVAVMAIQKFENSLGVFEKSEGEENSFSLGLDTLYHMNMYIRMLATLDDILIKIGVYTHLVDEEKSSGQLMETYMPEHDSEFRGKYERLRLERKGYPKLPNRNNRNTRKYRNDITHGSELMITKGTVIEDSIIKDISPSGVFERNLKVFNETKEKMINDLDIIYKNQNFFEDKIVSLIDVRKRTY
ncbi:hypothetical protein K2V69_09375 [Staphylococcus gallinarum]|uniref:hypothetical protein n=1 Tax=Staphylococcus gallinarum TaxID=1293 RepID=UPI001E4F869E|nr:hypothetical protein [Staphylococcus gallinarum]MCD8920909.1 hypothetical protein [Staphylococcus gallinarum]